MRYLLLGITVLFTAYAWAADGDYNESIAAISYNPSRMGTYSHLKVVRSADFAGGLEVAEDANVNIMTTGTVTVSNVADDTTTAACTSGSDSDCYKIKNVVPMAAVGEADYCSNHATDCTAAARSTRLLTDSGTIVQGETEGTYVSEVPNIVNGSVWTGAKRNWPFDSNGVTFKVGGGEIASATTSSVFVKKLAGQASSISLDTSDATLIMNEGTTCNVTGVFKLGGITINNPGNNKKLMWHLRKDQNGNTAYVLSACTGC